MLHTILTQLIREGTTPSLSISIYGRDGSQTDRRLPDSDFDPVYDVASLTKPLVSFPLAHKHIPDLNAPVERFLPSFPPSVTIRNLLNHTAGLIPWLPCYHFDPPYHETILHRGFGAKGKTYSCLGYLLLARVLESVTNRSFRSLAAEYLEDATGCEMEPGDRPDVMPTETGNRFEQKMAADFVSTPDPALFRPNIVIKGLVHDLNAFHDGGFSGNSGLFATAAGCVLLARRLVQLPEWQLPLMKTDNYYYHFGFTGTGIAISPDAETIVVFLSNRIHPSVQQVDYSLIRHRIFHAVLPENP